MHRRHFLYIEVQPYYTTLVVILGNKSLIKCTYIFLSLRHLKYFKKSIY